MDFTVRDWLIVIGGLLALAVLLDGYRRMRNDRRDSIRLSSRKRRDEAEDELTNPELPGGSARVVAVRETTPSLHVKRGGDTPASANSPAAKTSSAKAASAKHRPEPRVEPSFDGPDSDDGDETQILDDAAGWAKRPVSDDDILFRDPEDEYDDYGEEGYGQDVPGFETESEAGTDPDPVVASDDEVDEVEEGYPDEPDDEPVEAAEMLEGLRANREERAVETSAPLQRERQEEKRSAGKPAAKEEPDYHELIVLNVVAASGQTFKGADLLQILLACDVRYGKMNIFHRYEKADGTGEVQFSIANLVEPGNFELDSIEEFTTPGLIFFLNLPGPEKSIKAFDAMVETANCLVKNLGGELRDQSHSVATKQTLEHYRQRIRDFERRQLTLM